MYYSLSCLASSPGRMSRTDVWISRDEMVDFFEYAASSEIKTLNGILDHDDKLTRSLGSNAPKDVVNKAIEKAIALFEIPVLGWTCLRTAKYRPSQRESKKGGVKMNLVDVRA